MDKLALMEEAYKRGILPENKKPLFDEAVRRGLIKTNANNAPKTARTAQQQPPVDDVPQWGRDNPNFYGAYGAAKGVVDTAVNTVEGLGKAAINLPGSTLHVLNETGKAILHPFDTAQAMGEVVTGGLQKLVPGEQENEQQFNAVVDFYKNRYGDLAGLKTAIEERPAEVLADISAIATMGGAAVPRSAGAVKTALQTVGKAADPLNMTTSAAKAIAKPAASKAGELTRQVVGTTTGAGPEAINQALKGEGLTSKSSDFVKAMREGVQGEDILTDAMDALSKVKENRATAYQKQLAKVAENKTAIDLRPIKGKLESLMKNYGIKRTPDGELDFSRSTLSTKAHNDVASIINRVDEWGTQAGDNTALGLDTLKRQLDDLYTDTNNGRAFITSLKNEVKGTIIRNVPDYAKLVGDYEAVSGPIKEIERALSLNNRAMMDTSIKKLQSAMRENFKFRNDLLQQLQEMSGRNLSATIAGGEMSQLIPKGLVGKLVGGSGVVSGQMLNPYFISLAAVSSPRVMGEFLNTLGYSRNQARKVVEAAKKANAFTAGKRSVVGSAAVAQEQAKANP